MIGLIFMWNCRIFIMLDVSVGDVVSPFAHNVCVSSVVRFRSCVLSPTQNVERRYKLWITPHRTIEETFCWQLARQYPNSFIFSSISDDFKYKCKLLSCHPKPRLITSMSVFLSVLILNCLESPYLIPKIIRDKFVFDE